VDEEKIKLNEDKYRVKKRLFPFIRKGISGYDTEKFKGNKRCNHTAAYESDRGKQVHD